MANNTMLMLNKRCLKTCCNNLKRSSYISNRKKHYDIAIAGGGLVGTAMACAVARNPKLSEKKILIIETAPKKNNKRSVDDEYSNRVVSLNPATRKFFESIGSWKYISEVRYKTVKKMQVWDACSDALITFNDDLVNDVSYIIENDLILYSLEKVCLEEKDKIEIKYKSSIKNFEVPFDNKPVVLEMEDGDKHTCELLIGADGANSRTRQKLKFHYLSWNYHQKGVVATLKLSEASDNLVAWQRFLPKGPIALLPLTNELSSLVWSTETKEAEELLRLSDESFVDAINDAFWKQYPRSDLVTSAMSSLNKVLESLMLSTNAVQQLPPCVISVLPNSRAAYPLGFGHSSTYVCPGVALVGDSAHRVHPLAGQGVNLGFRDVECLTKFLGDAVYSGKRMGAFNTLADYQSERQAQIVPMLAVTDLLQKLYSTSSTPVVLLRSLGLQVTHALNPLKKIIIDRASS